MNPENPNATTVNSLANYKFSPDELKILRQCDTDSFFQRSLPFGTGIGLAAYYGVQKGYLTRNSKYGAVPKVVVGVIIGYFLGKVSYQQKCAEKLMSLPNSKIGELLKQRSRGSIYDSLTVDKGLGAGLALAPFSAQTPDMYSDLGVRNSTFDLDTERPNQPGLDDFYRPISENPGQPNYEDNLPSEPPKHTVTYDELRKKNREEYEKRQQSLFNRPTAPDTVPVIRAKPQNSEEQFENIAVGQKNKYGDVWK